MTGERAMGEPQEPAESLGRRAGARLAAPRADCLRRRRDRHADLVGQQRSRRRRAQAVRLRGRLRAGLHQGLHGAVPGRRPSGERLRQRRRGHRQAARRLPGGRHQPLRRGGRRDGGQARSRAAARHLAHRELGPHLPRLPQAARRHHAGRQALHGARRRRGRPACSTTRPRSPRPRPRSRTSSTPSTRARSR